MGRGVHGARVEGQCAPRTHSCRIILVVWSVVLPRVVRVCIAGAILSEPWLCVDWPHRFLFSRGCSEVDPLWSAHAKSAGPGVCYGLPLRRGVLFLEGAGECRAPGIALPVTLTREPPPPLPRVRGQDDRNDYLRIHHGMWHFCAGCARSLAACGRARVRMHLVTCLHGRWTFYFFNKCNEHDNRPQQHVHFPLKGARTE